MSTNTNVSGCGCGGGCGSNHTCGYGGKGNCLGRGCGCSCGGRKKCCKGGCGPSHFTTLANEVVGLPCDGCNTPHEGRHCRGCRCCGCQDLLALASAPAVVSGVGLHAKTAKRPIAYSVVGCDRCRTHSPRASTRAAVSGCACSRVSAEVSTASGLGHYKNKHGKPMYRFIGPDNYFYEGMVAGGTVENPSLINIRRVS